ncbi:MAG: PKD domain-containing protein [Saprospiraceae bacterium]|nr:PKD domain-containing protein [Saprospiraceae bacterium]MDW8230617.1 PKD domain-containing protein [Saprospiraceae bacterium]
MKRLFLFTAVLSAVVASSSLAQVTVGQPNVNETANDVLLHSDGTFIISGSEGAKGALYKVTCNGTVLEKLTKTYAPGPTAFYESIQLADGNIIAVGETEALVNDTPRLQLLLVKTTPDLKEIASKTLLVNGKWGRGRSVALAPNGDLLVLGETEGVWLDFTDVFMLRINANTLNAVGGPAIYSYGVDNAQKIKPMGNGEYLISMYALIGNIFSADAPIQSRLVTIKINEQGQKQWEYIFEYTRLGKYGFCRAGGAVRGFPPASNNIVVCGALHHGANPDSLTDAVFILLDLSGKPLDTLVFPLPGRQELMSLIASEAQPDFFVAVGRTVPASGPATAHAAGVVAFNGELFPAITVNETTLPITLHDAVEIPFGRFAFLGTFPEFFFLPTRDIILITPGIEDIQLRYQNCVLSATFSVPDPKYQWYRDSLPIPGATQGTYKPTRAGRYFVKITDAFGCSGFSDTLFISWPKANFTWTVNGASVLFLNSSTDALTYQWSFGDGTVSTQKEPFHTYAQDGTYVVRLIARGPCGADTLQRTIVILTPPKASFSFDPSGGCPGQAIQFTNLSSANATSFRWLFPGGVPSTSTAKNPKVTYPNPGTYSATLIATNTAGSDTIVQSNIILILPPPKANFNAIVTGGTVSFINLSTEASLFVWDFGDGTKSTLPAPSHTYAASGQYVVTLIATGLCGSDTTRQVIGVVNATEAAQQRFTVGIMPNPNAGIFALTLQGDALQGEVLYSLLSADGRLIDRQTLWAADGRLQQGFTYEALAPGLYTVFVQAEGAVRAVRLVIK